MTCPHEPPGRQCSICRMETLEDYFGDGSDNYDEEWPGLVASQKKAKEAGGS